MNTKIILGTEMASERQAIIDSASHMTDETVYPRMLRYGDIELVLAKLERDYRDVSIFPEIREMLEELYRSWKRLLEEYKEVKKDII